MNSVYIIQEQDKMNYIPAEEWGCVKFLTSGRFNPAFGGKSLHIIDECRYNLKEFNPVCDYLVPTGSPTLIGIVTSMVVTKFGMCRFLQWDNMNKRYFEFKWSNNE